MELRERWADWDCSPFTAESTKHVSCGRDVRIELRSRRAARHPAARVEDPMISGESEEWIREKIDRFERDGG
jgi:hypothetical protein